jgi:hypothetical protein
MDRDADLNRELAWLRARYAGFAWAAGLMASLASLFPVAALMLFIKVAVFDMLYGAFFVLTLALVLTALLGHALDLGWIDVVSQSPQLTYDRYLAAPGRRSTAASAQRRRIDRMADRRTGEAVEGARTQWSVGSRQVGRGSHFRRTHMLRKSAGTVFWSDYCEVTLGFPVTSRRAADYVLLIPPRRTVRHYYCSTDRAVLAHLIT